MKRLALSATIVAAWLALLSSMPQIYKQAERWLCFCGFPCAGIVHASDGIAMMFLIVVGIGGTASAVYWITDIWSRR